MKALRSIWAKAERTGSFWYWFVTFAFVAVGSVLLIAVILVLVPKEARGEGHPGMSCGTYEYMIADIIGPQYNEVVLWHGRAADGSSAVHIEMYVNQETGTWTIITSDPNPERDVSCAPAYGDEFKPGPRPVEAPGSPT